MSRRPIAPIAGVLCLLLLHGCSQKEPPSAPKGAQRPKLVIGLLPERNIFKQLERYEPLARYLSSRTGTKVELKILPRYGNIIDNFQSSGLDGAFFGSFTYSLAHAKLGVEVIVRPLAPDNTSTYHGLIFVRKDSGIRNARDMKGKRFAFVDKATTAGYLLPLGYFHANGITEYKKYLKEAYFAGTHEDAIYDVLDKKADIAAVKNTVYDRVAQTDKRVARDLIIIETSPEVPENGLAVRSDLDS